MEKPRRLSHPGLSQKFEGHSYLAPVAMIVVVVVAVMIMATVSKAYDDLSLGGSDEPCKRDNSDQSDQPTAKTCHAVHLQTEMYSPPG